MIIITTIPIIIIIIMTTTLGGLSTLILHETLRPSTCVV